MKLSEMPAEKAFDTMSKMLPDISDILDSKSMKDCKELYKAQKKPKNSEVLLMTVPTLMSEKKEAVFRIAALVQDVPVEEVKKQTLKEITTAFEEAMDYITRFFMLSLSMVAKV